MNRRSLLTPFTIILRPPDGPQVELSFTLDGPIEETDVSISAWEGPYADMFEQAVLDASWWLAAYWMARGDWPAARRPAEPARRAGAPERTEGQASEPRRRDENGQMERGL